MTENQTLTEQRDTSELGRQVSEIFERRAMHGDRRLIVETYREKFNKLVLTMPSEKRDTMAVSFQKVLVDVKGYVSEYGARFSDFVRNIVMWPMVRATKDFPRDKNYQIGLARAAAWGDFANSTTKTATAERTAYKKNFLPSAIIGTESGILPGTFIGASLGGVIEGTKVGLLTGGLYGAAIGAVAGAAIGGGISLGIRLKDRIMGPPAVYYDLFSGVVAPGATGSSVHSGGGGASGGGR